MSIHRTFVIVLVLALHAASADATTYFPDRLVVRCPEGLVSVDGKPVVPNTAAPQPGNKGDLVIGSGPFEIRYRYVREGDHLVFTVARLPKQYLVMEGDPATLLKKADRFEVGRSAHVVNLIWLPKRNGKPVGQEPRRERVILSFQRGEVASHTVVAVPAPVGP